LQVPIGTRQAHALTRKALLQLVQSQASLDNLERSAIFDLQDIYRQLIESVDALRIQRAGLSAAQRQAVARIKELQLGQGLVLNLVTALDNLVDQQEQFQLILCDYNIALANWERQKGTILRHENINISEGPLPCCAAGRASEAIRKRQAALLLL